MTRAKPFAPWMLVTSLSLLACSEDRPETLEARADQVHAGRVDHGPGPDPVADPLGAQLHRRVLEQASLYEEVGDGFRGSLNEGEVSQHQLVLIGTWCYLLLAEGGPGVEELDLLITDMGGAPLLRDNSEGAAATLGDTHPVCPYSPGIHQVQVKMKAGEGEYVLRVFRSQVF